ncbi:glycosyl transferase family 1, partial [Staphylococcus pseudintermedius]|nr:glycosyl transferase family 1 [Staphylococcus pseudintermedius]
MKKVFMIVHELDVNKGGMTTAMLTRSKVFYDNKIAGNIVTFDYKLDYPEIIQAVKESKKMDRRTEMLNPFDFYKAKADRSKIKRNPTIYKAIDQLLKGTVEIKESQSVSRYFNQKTGAYVAYKKSFENTSFLDIFENNKRIKRIYYREEKIQKIDVFNHENKLTAEQFFDSKCYLYLYRQINAKNGSVGQTYLI